MISLHARRNASVPLYGDTITDPGDAAQEYHYP